MEPVVVTNESQKLGFLDRIGSLIFSPSKVFAELVERPDFLWPVIFTVLSLGLSLPFSGYTQKLMADSFPKYADILAQSQQNKPSIVLTLASGLIGLLLLWLIGTAIYYLLAKLLGGQSLRFFTFLAIIGYTSIARTVQTAFQGITLMTAGFIPPVGLETGLELSKRFFTPMGIFLSSISPFAIWEIILVVIALEKAFKLSRGKAIFISLLYWAGAVGIGVGGAVLSFGFLK